MFEVYVNDTLVKSYPYKTQAIVYCFMNGYVNTGRGWYFLDDRVKIKEVKNGKSRKRKS